MTFKVSAKLAEFWFPVASGRVLAVIRIILGSAMLYDVLTLLPQRHLLFGSEGLFGIGGSRRPYVTPVSWLENHGSHVPGFDETGINLLFAFYICSIILFLVGYAYRVAAVVMWLIFYYLNLRNYLVFDSGHSLAFVLIFFLLFVPADATGSLRSLRFHNRWQGFWKEKLIPNAWSLRAIQLQLCIVYFSTFLFKMEGAAWRDGTAVYYATRMPMYVRSEMQTLFNSPWLTYPAVFLTLSLESLFPVLIWFPRWRIWLILFAIVFHVALERSFWINTFQWVMIAAIFSFLPVPDKVLQQKEVRS